ncbi:MAG: 4-hydroxythreonine-4-phosphate dehydrogenase PdxA [Woeseia sp.]|nr:4-hydroxythreonine-4-phosphate dehydrogenase PdxA [Woeseia sp.]NNL54532.1 4-hydroxythreonine-4-phosphate dehydrogenase PdxA [Woeseia sp.]
MAAIEDPKPLVLTAGEPAGIGPDLCIALAQTALAHRLVVIADPQLLIERAKLLNIPLTVHEYGAGATGGSGALTVLPQTLARRDVIGKPDPANAATLLDALRIAVKGCLEGRFAAMVTAPLQKSTINDAGIAFSGHTEFLAELTEATTPVMLLVADQLRVALASTHMPLSAVPAYLTADRIQAVIEVLYRDLKIRFGIDQPKINVCGLNPHAGEGGHLGTEDRDIIAPVIELCRRSGMQLTGPLPADTAFTPAAGQTDAVLAMYHDQGLPVLKYASFGHGVNVTLGLPIVRTSVDHGTALDLAGSGRADAGSLIAAIELAASLSPG